MNVDNERSHNGRAKDMSRSDIFYGANAVALIAAILATCLSLHLMYKHVKYYWYVRAVSIDFSVMLNEIDLTRKRRSSSQHSFGAETHYSYFVDDTYLCD